MNPIWFAGSTAYTMAKYGMSMCVLGMAAELRNQAEQSRPAGGGTYFDQVSGDSSLFLTFVVSPDLSRHWKLMLYKDGSMIDAMAGSVSAPRDE